MKIVRLDRGGLHVLTQHPAWALIALAALAAAAVMTARGLSLDWPTVAMPALTGSCLMVLATFYKVWRSDERLSLALAATAQLVIFSACAEVLSYAVATFDAPLCDRMLMSWDRALGFDWSAYLGFVEARPWLASAYGLAYKSILVQFVLVTLGLGLTGRLVACRAFATAVIVSGIVVIAVSALLPATSVFIHLGLATRDYPALDLSAILTSLVPFEALRNGTTHLISLRDAEGIITFPSYHAALGVILARAFWHLPWLRWPGLLLNIIMVASTPLNGGHYFTDVLAGGMVALGAMVAARALDRPAAAAERDQPAPASVPGEPLAARA